MVSLILVEHTCGKFGKLLKHDNKVYILINKNMEITKLFKKNISKVITSKILITSNKVVISEKILNNI